MSEKNKYPKLYVKNFAKIKEAEIELAPFTLFVGDNNSCKTYLSTLVYGLIKYTSKIIYDIFEYTDEIKNSNEYKKVTNIINDIIDKNEEVNLSLEDKEDFIKLFNFLLNKYSNKLINYIFNSSDIIHLDYINLDFTCYINEKIYIEINKRKIDNKEFYNIELDYNRIISYSDLEENRFNIINIIMSFMIRAHFDISLYMSANIVFFPVSRTGLLSTKNNILKSYVDKFNKINSFDDNLIKEELLSNTWQDFLKKLIDLSGKIKEENRFKEIVSLIEDNIIDGKINVNQETGGIYYIPNFNKGSSFPMYLSSAVITETAPLYLFLKYGFIKERLIMEEPEISLHPELQQQLTRVFIKLVNSYIHILITTHSDTIIQHINNMIKLNSNDEERKKYLMNKYGYDEDDLISEDKVRMYQFDIEEDGFTKVTKLESSEYGFEVPTFNKVLKKISDEIYDFQEEL
ncbi:hypothetical protein BRSU_0331 [Brachyspira suanatina]|uniref:Endonuclease GajA/Old nuclease/RecF-like AAA domain-containing protein n=1 Tax=Brachyspira suanatina TaxID=381802 RepID=A0A0G4K4K6_9SPIR|nr:AAA family ATPase [Brachyspira suanatina]CRF31726.1 hypothetical protein BRSU_0331 [Brachyspira suanatina]